MSCNSNSLIAAFSRQRILVGASRVANLRAIADNSRTIKRHRHRIIEYLNES